MADNEAPVTNIKEIAERAAKEEQEMIAKEKAAKAQLEAAMKEEVTQVTPEVKDAKVEKTREGFSVVRSEPFLEDGAEEKEDDALKTELRKRAEEKKDSIFKRTKKKVAIKLGKLAFVIADAERFVYEKFHLNAPIMTQEEIDADYIETYEDTKEVIDNRIGLESENGDIWNLGITVGAHFAKRGFRYYTGGRKKVDRSFEHPQDQQEEENEEGTPRFSSVAEEAAWLAQKAEREGRRLAP